MHINSEHPISSKKSIPFSQVLRVKCTCSAVENFKLYPSERKKIIEKGYKSELDKHILAIEKLDRNEMLKEKVREKPKQTCIPPTLTYNRFCPNISTWYENIGTYRSNESLKQMLNCQPVTAFTRDRNIKELIRSNKTQKNKVKKEKFRN